MPLFYKIVRDNRADYDNLYFGRAVQTNTINTDGLADIIQRNCSMKKSDVIAVLTELVEVMTDQLQNSMTVKLDGFGSFRLGIKTKGAVTEDKFSVTKNIVGMRVNFLAEGKRNPATNKVQRVFLNGCRLQKYDSKEQKAAEESQG